LVRGRFERYALIPKMKMLPVPDGPTMLTVYAPAVAVTVVFITA
jgi:hypothetical protein